MKVGILGAGLSGLSCAITLEQHGIRPVIMEKRACVGDRFVNAEALFSILDRPVSNSMEELAQRYQIDLKPLSTVTKLILHSRNQVGGIEGRIGFLNVRGRHQNSFENQLARQVKSEIRFHSECSYEEAVRSYDRVVLATGDGEYARKLGNYRCDLTISLKGATVEGEFQPDVPHVWFRCDLIPKGYAWLIPFSEREANLVIAYPDDPETHSVDIAQRWKAFYELAQNTLAQKFPVTDQFQVTRYAAGICQEPKVGSTYFVGNCFGALSPGLGFGQFNSILTGIYAALDICGIQDYGEAAKGLFANYDHSLALRRYLERIDDDTFDSIVKGMNLKLLKAAVTHFFSSDSSVDLLKWLTPLLKA